MKKPFLSVVAWYFTPPPQTPKGLLENTLHNRTCILEAGIPPFSTCPITIAFPACGLGISIGRVGVKEGVFVGAIVGVLVAVDVRVAVGVGVRVAVGVSVWVNVGVIVGPSN